MKVMMIFSQNMFTKRNSGGTQCTKRNYELLCNAVGSENVTLCYVGNDPEIPSRKDLYRFPTVEGNFATLLAALEGHAAYRAKTEKQILSLVRESGCDLVFIEPSYYGTLAKKLVHEKKTMVFFHNIETRYYTHTKQKGVKFFQLPRYLAIKNNEKNAVIFSDCTVLLNERDSLLLKEYFGKSADFLAPISFADCYDEKKLQQPKRQHELLFVGSHFAPNCDGVRWFVKEVLPLIPEFTLRIVGLNMELMREELQSEQVQVIGTVEDLSNEYYTHAAMVMPILYGDGMKVKTAEAMMYGRTIFATDEALEGYDIENVKGIYRCNTSEEFASNIRKAFQEQLPLVQTAVRERFLRKYETQCLTEKFKEKVLTI